MSLTENNEELVISPDHAFIFQGFDVACKITLLAGAPEITKTALCNFLESVEIDKIQAAVKDLLHAQSRNLGRTRWLNHCDFSELFEPFNVKVAFVSSDFRMYGNNAEARPSITFRVLLTLVEHRPQDSPEFNSFESEWNFNTLERVRETAEDI